MGRIKKAQEPLLENLTPRSSSAVSIKSTQTGPGPSTVVDLEPISQKTLRRNKAKKKARVKRICKLFSKCWKSTKLVVLTVFVVLLVYFTLIYTDVLRVEHFLTIRKHLGMKGRVVMN